MNNSLFSRTVGALWDKIYQEALAQTGTWSLATYRELMQAAQSFKHADTQFLINKITSALADLSMPSQARFKLAQIFSCMYVKNVPFSKEILDSRKTELVEICARWPRDDLSKTALELLSGLFGKQIVRPVSSSPPPVSPVRPTVTKNKRQVTCRTPSVASPARPSNRI